MLPRDLEDWLTEEGGRIVEKAVKMGGEDRLDERERLLHEVWLLDTEQRNGGLSQYFCNWGLERWRTLARLAAPALPSFARFTAKIDAVVQESSDPYEAILACGVSLDGWYEEWQTQLVPELRVRVGGGAG